MTELRHVHVVGIAGVGMSALAEILLSSGCRVSGSDRYIDAGMDLPVIRCLSCMGAELVPQDGSGIRADTTAVAVSTAVEPDNPEIAAARSIGVPILHRSELLAQLVHGQECVAVTGTAGKSTVVGMLGWILEQLGRDPTVVNGAPVLNWAGNRRLGSTRFGRSGLCVVEADESDRSLLNLDPDWAVLTNMSADHFSLEDTRDLFDEFLRKARQGVVDVSRGLSPDVPPVVGAQATTFVYQGVSFGLNLPGLHNMDNALCAIEVCQRLGHAPQEVRHALGTFRGLWRRLQVVGTGGGVTVIDDYAHNPAKIEAAWRAVAPHCRRVHSVWRPHGYGPLAKMLDELAEVFGRICRGGGRVYILPVYDMGGTADRSVCADDLVAAIGADAGEAVAVDSLAACEVRVAGAAAEGDTVLCMGARDPELPVFCRRLLERLHAS